MQRNRLKLSCPTGLIVAACLASFTGCVDSTSLAEPWPIEEDGKVETPDSPASPDVRSWCLPRPVAYDRALVPSLPPEVDYDTMCDVEPVTLPNATATTIYALRGDERRVDVEEFGTNTASFSYAEEGHLSLVEIEGEMGFYGASSGRSTYALDDKGEVVHKTAAEPEIAGGGIDEPGELTFVKTQTFEGDRLVSRIERDGEDGPILKTFEWTWRDDQLLGATIEDHSGEEVVTQQTEWTYDAATGLPTSVERSIQGIIVERHQWSYTAESALANRTSWRRSPASLQAEHGGKLKAWTLAPELDTYVSQHRPPGSTNLGELGRESSVPGDCAPLPTGRHGYPARESVYVLGVERGERPAGIAAAHGANVEAHPSADEAWFGHDGVATGLGTEAFDEVSTDVRYDSNGRMIEATINANGTARIERERLFDGDRLVSDQVISRATGERVVRTLTFTYDEEGRVMDRTLLDDGALLARHTWKRDERGRVIRYETSSLPTWPHSPEPNALLEGLQQGTGATEAAAWWWTYDGARLVARGGGPQGFDQTLSYNEDGRLTQRLGKFAGELFVDETWTFDEEGRLIERCTNGEEAASKRCIHTTYDPLGRVAYRERRSPNAPDRNTPTVIEYNSYVCE